jgi:NADPH:quinone reductase-like Zn-dependent oxidoreductase
VGDEVLGFTHERASQAELVIVEAANVVGRPPNVPWEVAGSLFVAGTTAWAAVRAIAPKPGETVVVAGAAGGVGSIAVQLLRRAGPRVIGLASEPHHEWLRAHGVTPLWYGPGVEDRIREAAGGSLHAFIDLAGHGYVRMALDLGVEPRRIDTIADFQAAAAFGVQTAGNADGGTAEVLAELAGLIDRGELELPIDRVYPLDEVRTAYHQLEEGHTRGKIALAIAT